MMTIQAFVNSVGVAVCVFMATGSLWWAIIPLFIGDFILSIVRKEK